MAKKNKEKQKDLMEEWKYSGLYWFINVVAMMSVLTYSIVSVENEVAQHLGQDLLAALVYGYFSTLLVVHLISKDIQKKK